MKIRIFTYQALAYPVVAEQAVTPAAQGVQVVCLLSFDVQVKAGHAAQVLFPVVANPAELLNTLSSVVVNITEERP